MRILAVQNRMGIGDTVIFLPFIKAISEKFNSPVSLLVKKNSKADQYLYQTDYIDEIIFLEKEMEGSFWRNGFLRNLDLIINIKKYNFDKIIVFNSSLRFNLIAKLSGIKEIYQYPLFEKDKQHITNTPRNFLKNKLDLDVNQDPEIQISKSLILETIEKFQIKKNETNILLGIGGSGPTKRIPAKIFLNLIEKISKNRKCKFFLATGKDNQEQIILSDILNSKFKNLCVPLDDLSIKEILPIIKNCKISICNDSSFSHLSSALGIMTITLMADTPLIYGNYSSKMFPVIPDGEKTVTHKTLGKEKINPQKIFDKFIELVN